jgi:GrpB-like predicted nucleotidyltransferase (UPF0157 family)
MDEIILSPYDPAWPQKFELERRFVAGCFEQPPVAIEHVGSTSIPGLTAKPIIDILVLVDDLAEGRRAVAALEAGGYSFWRDNPDKTKLFLVKGLPPTAAQRTHHLHIHADAAELARHLAFRDALRSDAGLRDAYADLKRDLAARYHHDREAYSNAKTEFVDAVVAGAGGPPRSVPRGLPKQ